MKLELRVDCSIDLNEMISIVRGNSKEPFMKNASGVCLDTRAIKPGDLFFAIQGVQDGHNYVEKAMQMGAAACVVSRDMGVKNQIMVSDTLQALWAYAGWYRSQWKKPIIALSGSNGKTSTKEMMAKLLGDKTMKTPGNWNNFLGVPLTLLMLRPEHAFGVVEMGINHFGELLQLCKFTKPDIAVLTNVGPAHLQELHDLDGVAKAKGEIFSQLQPDNIAVLNIDDSRIEKMKSNIRAQVITVSQSKSANVQLLSKTKKIKGYDLQLKYGDKTISTELPVNGEHNISNYLCCLGVAYALKISADQIVERTAMIQQIHMRMEEIDLPNNRKIINDCYNANPGSFQAGLQTVSETKPKRFLVLMGDMLELGKNAESIHRDMGKLMFKFGVNHLFAFGPLSKEGVAGAVEGGLSKDQVTWIEKKEDAVQKILPYFNAGDILLVKGSRGMKLEEIVHKLERQLKGS